MTLSDDLTSAQAASMVGVSVPTLLRYAGNKVGNGMIFPNPVRHSRRLFSWNLDEIERWVNLNGKAPPTKRGRPRGSFNKLREHTERGVDDQDIDYSVLLPGMTAE